MLMVLSGLEPGRRGRMVEAVGSELFTARLEDLGLCPGTVIKCLHRSPAGTPAAYDIQGAVIALRKKDGEKIWIEALP